MEDDRFKSEMMRLMGTVINKLDRLETDVSELKFDVSELKSGQKEHTQILRRLDSKTDNIVEKVLEHEIRLTKAEQNIEDLRGGIH